MDDRPAGRSAAPPAAVGDLDSTEAIATMVRCFYREVAQDDLLGPVFNDVARVDWPDHLPKLTAFWSRALLGEQGYDGNPFRAHRDVHARAPFTTAHFDRWLELFRTTIEVGWAGPNADRALDLAHRVAQVHHRQLVGSELRLPEPEEDPATGPVATISWTTAEIVETRRGIRCRS